MEIGHLLRESRLLLLTALEPKLETGSAVLGESAVTVNLHGDVQHGFGDAQPGDAVYHRGKGTRQLAHKIGGSQDAVPQLGRRVVVLDAGALDEVGHVHAGGAGHLAAFAIKAVLEGLVKEIRILEPEAFTVGAGLLGAGVQRIGLEHGAVCRAHRALHALLKVMVGLCVFL